MGAAEVAAVCDVFVPWSRRAELGDRSAFLSRPCSGRLRFGGRPSWETDRTELGWREVLVAYMRGVPSGQYMAQASGSLHLHHGLHAGIGKLGVFVNGWAQFMSTFWIVSGIGRNSAYKKVR
jgi:hypothetical protein